MIASISPRNINKQENINWVDLNYYTKKENIIEEDPNPAKEITTESSCLR